MHGLSAFDGVWHISDMIHRKCSYMCPPVMDKDLHLIDDTKRTVWTVLVLLMLP